MIPEIDDVKKVACVLADPEGFKSVTDEFIGMFDREIFDCIITSGRYGHLFGGILADNLNSCVVCADDSNNFCKKSLKSGWKVIIVGETLEDGTKQLDLIQKIESCECNVIRVGFISEQKSFGARKSKILRKYPFEAVYTF